MQSTGNPYALFSKPCTSCDERIYWTSYPDLPERLEPPQERCVKCAPEVWR